MVDLVEKIARAIAYEMGDTMGDSEPVFWNGYSHKNSARTAAKAAIKESGLNELINALISAAGEFDLVLQRLRYEQPERAEGAAICGAKNARVVLEKINEDHSRWLD